MAGYGKALNMEVIYTDPSVESRNFERVSFFDLLERSDAVSIHAHLCEATVNLFNSDAFMHMKSSSYLINTSRGKIVDENALILALESKDIAGYATDVIEDEYSGDVSPLVEYSKTHSNVIITPHIGGMTREARESTDVFMAKKIRDTLKAHEPASVS
jgi:D-3-phosphoglycerate dehydrogenase